VTGAELVRGRRGAVAVLRLNRPEARNALSPALVSALGAAVVEADADPEVRAVVLTGTGDRAFCAGMDLRAFADGDRPGTTDDGGTQGFVDPVGGALAEPALRSLRWGGRFVTVGYASGEIPCIPLNLVLLKGVRVLGFELRGFVGHAPGEFRRNTDELIDQLATGRVVPHIGATFALDETPAALRHVADGKAIGKVVIAVTGSTG
jgi:NADPH:quinone reductase-like Zn-dependent oxidoreductase